MNFSSFKLDTVDTVDTVDSVDTVDTVDTENYDFFHLLVIVSSSFFLLTVPEQIIKYNIEEIQKKCYFCFEYLCQKKQAKRKKLINRKTLILGIL